jgi:hypothetical protein
LTLSRAEMSRAARLIITTVRAPISRHTASRSSCVAPVDNG